MLFDTWPDFWRVAVAAALVYPFLVLVLRLSGKRTLAKMNAFDLVVTVALGSTLATVLLSSDVALAEGGLALVCLVVLQFAAAWLSVHLKPVRRLLKSAPTAVMWEGELLRDALRAQRVTEGEIRQAVRSQGIGDLALVAAVVLETDGSMSVIPRSQIGDWTALDGIAPAVRRSVHPGASRRT